MSISLTVDRQKLITQLTNKRAEIIADYETNRVKLQAQLDGLATSIDGWTTYHQEVIDGLANGSYKYTESGKLSVTDRRHTLPVKPSTTTQRGRWGGTRSDLERALEYLVEDGYYWKTDVEPYTAALALLDLSDDEKIEINGSDYQGLLSRPGTRNWNWS